MATAYARRIAPFLALLLLGACEANSHRGIADPPAAPSLAASSFGAWSPPQAIGALNTQYAELQPALSRDGRTLYFASSRPEHDGDADLDQNIWLSKRACDDCPWGPAVMLPGPVNTANTESAPSLSRDEHWLFFASGPLGSPERDIYVAYRADVHDDFAWGDPSNLGSGINTAAPEIAPSFFENDEGGAPQLFFNRGNPLGDIYMSEMNADGTWGTASPVAELNTPAFSEQRPSVSHDGREIYFWSNRSGTAQLWRATRASASSPWTDVEMVPAPINDAPSLHPFIHSHGRTETLLFSRIVNGAFDLFVSTRTRGRP